MSLSFEQKKIFKYHKNQRILVSILGMGVGQIPYSYPCHIQRTRVPWENQKKPCNAGFMYTNIKLELRMIQEFRKQILHKQSHQHHPHRPQVSITAKQLAKPANLLQKTTFQNYHLHSSLEIATTYKATTSNIHQNDYNNPPFRCHSQNHSHTKFSL